MTPPAPIGYLIPEFPGQTHSFFWREIQALKAHHGYETHIISTQLPPRKVTHEWVKDTNADYLFPIPVSAWPRLAASLIRRSPRLLGQADTRAILKRPKHWALLVLAVRLGHLCRQAGITHLHVHSCANAALIAALCQQLYGVSYSLVLHGPAQDYGPHQEFKWHGARFGFVVSEKLRGEMAEMLPDASAKTRIAPMGVDTDMFAPPVSPRPAAADPFHWFCCSRLNWMKGYDVLLDALAQISRDAPDLDWRLSIAGEDDVGGIGYRAELETKITQMGLTDRVILLGAITQTDVLKELHAADGFVLASKAEALGVAYMEAMACGLPTVGSDTGGVHELIKTGRDGLLVPPGDVPALTEALHKIMTDPALRKRLSEGGRARVVKNFGVRRSADALAQALLDFS
jgi:colanic acid/amylovoran biosynthesis glycosyltransferase